MIFVLKLGNLFQMAITGHRNALGDITKQQNLPKNAAAKDALGKVNREFISPKFKMSNDVRWGQGDKRLESCTWTRNWQRLTRRPRGASWLLSTCLFFYFVCLRRRPSTVPDIDEKDLENPQLCAEYTMDVYAYLRSCLRRRAIMLNSCENIL